MIIQNRWFAFQGPRRADLSGLPFGFLFVWFGGVGRLESQDRFGPHPLARESGFYIPSFHWRSKNIERLECVQLNDRENKIPHDWRHWPDGNQKCAAAAVQRAVDERFGAKIVRDRSFAHRRVDLSGQPWQLYREIWVRKAA